MINVGAIKEGYVLDHIQAGQALQIYHDMRLDHLKNATIAIITNAESKTMGRRKTIVKAAVMNGLIGMVFGGASIGAKIGRPDMKVINIAGDGCFRMNLNELATASRYNIPIIQIVINNHVLGMVRQWQTLFYGQRYSSTILDDSVDFVKVSEGLGVKAVRVSSNDEFKKAFDEALAANEPRVIECVIDNDDKVWPMVAPGAPIDQVFTEEDM